MILWTSTVILLVSWIIHSFQNGQVYCNIFIQCNKQTIITHKYMVQSYRVSSKTNPTPNTIDCIIPFIERTKIGKSDVCCQTSIWRHLKVLVSVRGHEKDFWGPSNVLFFDLGTGETCVFCLWKFFKWYGHDIGTLLYTSEGYRPQ